MGPQTGPWADGEPTALGGCPVGRLVAVDEPKAWLAAVGSDIESHSATVGELGMAPGAHQLADIGVAPAFDEQLRDAALQGFDLRDIVLAILARAGNQVGHIPAHARGEGDVDYAILLFAQCSVEADAKLGERLSAVLGVLGSATSDSLGRERLDFLIDAPRIQCLRDRVQPRVEVVPHLVHLGLEARERLRELRWLRLGLRGHKLRISLHRPGTREESVRAREAERGGSDSIQAERLVNAGVLALPLGSRCLRSSAASSRRTRAASPKKRMPERVPPREEPLNVAAEGC